MTGMDVFFAQALGTGEAPRDYKGRPMLVPRGAPAGARAPYTRASSYADRVKDTAFLEKWKMRYLAIALSQPDADDLRSLLAGETYQTHKPIDSAEKRASGHRTDAAIQRALDRQGIARKADRGTAIHAFCEPDNDSPVPTELLGDVKGYKRAIEASGIEEIETERFMACDELMAAGTGDGFFRMPDGSVIIGDRKTGRLDPGFAVQMAIYAHADFYNHQTDERQTLAERFPGGEFDDTRGVVFDIKPEGTKIYEIDLAAGWEVAKAISTVERLLTDDVYTLLHAIPEPDPVLEGIRLASSVDEITELWDRTGGGWNTDQITAAKARKEELL